MKKLMLSAIVLLMAGSVSIAQNEKAQAETAKAGPVMKFAQEEYNFGTINQGDKVEYIFEFENAGKEPLIITEAHGSCGCTVPEWPKEPIKKGEKGSIKITFNSAGKSGIQDKTVTITSNASDSPKVLHIKGNINVPPVTPDSKAADAPKK